MISPLSTARGRAAERSHAWQRKREQLLKTACTDIASRYASGVSVGKANRQTARKFRSRSLGNGRQLSLSAKSLERHWYRFIAQGDAAFGLRHVATRERQLDPLLLQPIVEGSIRRSKSIAQIMTETGIGNRAGCESLATIYRSLPAKDINRFLAAERSLIARRKTAEKIILSINAELRDLRAAAEEKFLSKGGS